MKRSLVAISLILLVLFFFGSCDDNEDNNDSSDKLIIGPEYHDFSELEGMDNVYECPEFDFPDIVPDGVDVESLPEECEFRDFPDCPYVIELEGKIWPICTNQLPKSFLCAEAYIKYMNATKFCDISSWRLPSFEELTSLIPEDKRYVRHISIDGYYAHIIKPFQLASSGLMTTHNSHSTCPDYFDCNPPCNGIGFYYRYGYPTWAPDDSGDEIQDDIPGRRMLIIADK